MKRKDLGPYLEAEVRRWSAKSYNALREELKAAAHVECREDAPVHLEVELLERKRDYVHVMVSVCSQSAKWSCYHPLSTSFIVHRDGRVER